MEKVYCVFVIGATNVGKSTFLKKVSEAHNYVGLVEVGRLMRAKYHPSHFKGEANPKHTAAEAWQMIKDEIVRNMNEGRRVILIDGQPRDQTQLEAIASGQHAPEGAKHGFEFIHLWAPKSVRIARANERDKDDPAKLALSMERIDRDCLSVYDILTQLITAKLDVNSFDTSDSAFDAVAAFDVTTERAARVVLQ